MTPLSINLTEMCPLCNIWPIVSIIELREVAENSADTIHDTVNVSAAGIDKNKVRYRLRRSVHL